MIVTNEKQIMKSLSVQRCQRLVQSIRDHIHLLDCKLAAIYRTNKVNEYPDSMRVLRQAMCDAAHTIAEATTVSGLLVDDDK